MPHATGLIESPQTMLRFSLRTCVFAFWMLSLLWSSAMPAMAGNGPHNWLVVYDPNDPHGIAIARYYQEARGFPERNLVAYAFPNSGDAITNRLTAEQGWEFVLYLRQIISERGLDGQIHGVTLVGQAPTTLRTSTPDSTASLTSALSLSPDATSQTDWELRTDDRNAAFRGPDDVGSAYRGNGNFVNTTGEFRSTTEIRSDLEFGGKHYWLATHLAYTGPQGLRRDEVIALIDRSVAADGSAPVGTIHWPLNINIRSKMREGQAAQVIAEWDEIGLDYHVFGQSFGGGGFTLPEDKTGAPTSHPVEERAVQGAIVGGFNFDVEGAANLYLPGSIAEHVTSFGGQVEARSGSNRRHGVVAVRGVR